MRSSDGDDYHTLYYNQVTHTEFDLAWIVQHACYVHISNRPGACHMQVAFISSYSCMLHVYITCMDLGSFPRILHENSIYVGLSSTTNSKLKGNYPIACSGKPSPAISRAT